MKKTFVLLMTLVLLTALSTEAFAGIESISLSNYEQEFTPEYRVAYKVEGGSLQSANNDYITLYFDSRAELTSTISPENIFVNSLQAADVRTYKEDRRVDVLVPADIATNQPADILIKSDAGIKNPVNPGTYKLEISTSRVSSLSSIKYDIIPVTISSPGVKVNPGITDGAAEYDISFRVSRRGGLTGGTDTISITFPQEATLPSSISRNEITVNGKVLDSGDVTIKENRLTFTVPSNVSIDQEGQVNVIIKSDANIKNPGKPGEYKVKASTSKDTEGALSNAYAIEESAVTELLVDVEPTSALAEALYNISFKTSPYGTLLGGKDKITIIFRSRVGFSNNISRTKIEVQGKSINTGNLEVDDQSISFTLPDNVNIGPENPVKIKILPGAGIKNPSKPGVYEIKVNTSSDRSTATSNSYRVVAEKKAITLKIDDITAYVDGRPVFLDAPAKILNGRTMVPVRFIAETLEAQVNWNDNTKEVDINLDGKNIRLRINSGIATVDQKRVSLDTAPVILDGRTMVPIRFIAENLGAEVSWDDKTQTVTLN